MRVTNQISPWLASRGTCILLAMAVTQKSVSFGNMYLETCIITHFRLQIITCVVKAKTDMTQKVLKNYSE